ncbi:MULTISPECIES: OmpA family protein [unclassified Cupriavidus]|uniref:OmpA family protein n=1 Tax=Cupriavidus sp. H19C3 TaxID=3241603 RepID=UPI003BF7DC0A
MKPHEIASLRRCAIGCAVWLVSSTSTVAQAGIAFAAEVDLGPPASLATAMEGPVYAPVPAAAADQAQIVFFRPSLPSSAARSQPAHIYLDGEFQTALMPGGFNRFCTTPGGHTLEAYIGDAPTYAGKASPGEKVDLAGGKTYFAAVSEDGRTRAMLYQRPEAERMLTSVREQRYVLSRASAAVPCTGESPEKPDFTLAGDMLFAFARSDLGSMTQAGRADLRNIAGQIRQKVGDATDVRVSVRGHADPIGPAAFNQRLSEARAETVRRVLVENGVPANIIVANGVGSSQPLVSCPKRGKFSARIDCNAPNRRVEIRVNRMP